MKRVYLFCSAGMSTSLLAGSMQKAANSHKLPVEVKAFPYEQLDEVYEREKPDCILLGPQVKFVFHDIANRFELLGVPVSMIEPADYGTMNGEKVLTMAVMLLARRKAGKS